MILEQLQQEVINLGTGQSGFLEVYQYGGIITQRWTDWNGTHIAIRGHYNNSWGTWKIYSPE